MAYLGGKTYLVIGATGGLGSSLVNALNSRGADVLALGNTQNMGVDITTEAGRAQVVELVSVHGGIDGLVVASGVVGFGLHGSISSVNIARIIEIDLVGPLQLVNKLLPHIHDEGNITLITGAVVDFPTLGMVAYTAAKAGLSASCAVLRGELRSRKINVLDARPPYTETGLVTRPLFGAAPTMKQGLDPADVAERIAVGIESAETELPPGLFS